MGASRAGGESSAGGTERAFTRRRRNASTSQMEATERDREDYARADTASEPAPPSADPRGAKKISHQPEEHDEAEHVATGVSPVGEIGARSIDRPLGEELVGSSSSPSGRSIDLAPISPTGDTPVATCSASSCSSGWWLIFFAPLGSAEGGACSEAVPARA